MYRKRDRQNSKKKKKERQKRKWIKVVNKDMNKPRRIAQLATTTAQELEVAISNSRSLPLATCPYKTLTYPIRGEVGTSRAKGR